MRTRLSVALSLAALLAASGAFAQAPPTLSYQGRLAAKDGTPMTGTAKLTFSVYAAAAGGTALWSEDHTVGFSDGFYAVFLGAQTPFPAALFDGSERFLEITVGTETLSPRQRVVSAPYAIAAGVARDVAGGTVNAGTLKVGGVQVFDAAGQLRPQAATSFVQRSELGASGTINAVANPVDWTALKGVPAGFADGTDDVGVTSVGVGFPLTTTGGATPTLGLTKGCAANQILKWDGSAWGCASDEVSAGSSGVASVTATAPLQSSGGSNPTLSLTTGCAPGEILKWSGSAWACAPDGDTLFTAGSGLSLVGNRFSLLTTCATDEVLKWNGTAWACAIDVAGTSGGGTVTGVTATLPLSSSGGASPNLTLPRATATVDGYLAGADFASFSAKVGAVTAGAPLVSSGGASPKLTLPRATASVDGYLAGTDFASFSAKVGAVTAGAPLVSSGGALPNLTLPRASSSTDGYLAATDFASFSSRLSGVQVTAPLSSSGGATPTLSLPKATSAADGYLAAADFAAFSAKISSVAAGTGVTIGGTASAPAVSVNYGTSATTAARGDDARLSDARAPTAGSSFYVQNQTASAQTAGFNLNGAGTLGALNVNGASRLGTGGYAFTAIKSFTFNWDPPATANGAGSAADVYLPENGIVIGVGTPPLPVPCGGFGCEYVAGFTVSNVGGGAFSFRGQNDATERVHLNFVNISGATQDPPAGTWRIVYLLP